MSRSFFFYHDATALVGQCLIIEDSRSHTDTPHSVGLPWTCDLYLTTHNTHKRRTHNPSKRAAADLAAPGIGYLFKNDSGPLPSLRLPVHCS